MRKAPVPRGRVLFFAFVGECREFSARPAVYPVLANHGKEENPMTMSRIEKSNWQAYFDGVARQLEGMSAEIDVEAMAIGSQVEADWVPLLGISYDPKSDVLSIAVEGLGHLIRRPQTVFVDVELGRLASMEVIDSDNVRHIVKLREPLPLPAPAQ
jgi:hypothetical protein